MFYTLKPHVIKYLVFSANDISAFHLIKLISDIEGELQSVRSELLLDSIFLKYGFSYPENYLRDTENYIQRYVFLMTERMSEAEELGLIPDERIKYLDDLFHLFSTITSDDWCNQARATDVTNARYVLSDYAFWCHENHECDFL
ncbi:TPA: hypothetical protein RSR67_002796 [Klebsiella pneumoniae]|nr:hypothetical protein [Klebsiella pneumoniae]